MDVRLDEVVLHALEKEPERRYQHASEVKTDVETIAGTPSAPTAAGKTAVPVHIKSWRDCWPWDTSYITLFLMASGLPVSILIPILLPWWHLKALWLFALAVPCVGFAAIYGVVGRRIRRLKAALPRPTGEVAECLMFRRPFQAPGLAVLHADRLELIPVTGSPITVVLADIVVVSEVRWFNGTRLWWKKGFVLELANGRRVGVAVAEPFARRWRARLSRGSLPDLSTNETGVAPVSSSHKQMVNESPGATPDEARRTRALPEPHFSRTALVGAVWIGLFFLNWVVSYTPPGWALGNFFRNSPLNVVADLFLFLPLTVLGFAAVAGGSVLGVVALRQIRQAQGQLRGFGLALFDVLFFPLVLLNCWAAWLAWRVVSQTGSGASSLAVAVLTLAALALNALLIRAAARVAKQFVNSPAPPTRPRVTGDWSQVFKAVALRLVLVLAVQLALFETLEQVSVHWKESAGELWMMALMVGSLAGLVWAFWPGYRLKRSWFFWAGGTLASAFLLLFLNNYYSWHLRPNLGLYQEADWVAQHPGFQRAIAAADREEPVAKARRNLGANALLRPGNRTRIVGK